MKINVTTTDLNITNHAGLIKIGEFLRNSSFGDEINALSTVRERKDVPSDRDIVYCMIGLYAIGKTSYEAIEEYRKDSFFREVLGIRIVPSCETLRQRIEALPLGITDLLRRWNIAIIAAGFADASNHSTANESWSESVEIGDDCYMIIDSDVSVLDNSKTKKEGVQWTYKSCDGYAPMFSYIGKSGYMLNNELREGSMHSNSEGSYEYFCETLAFAKQLKGTARLLSVLDSGNDDKQLLQLHVGESVEYLIKRNLRKEAPEQWLAYAKDHASASRTGSDGSVVYYASCPHHLDLEAEQIETRIVVAARERLFDKNGQMLIVPEIDVSTYWTSLNVTEQQVEKLYHQHGTSEQYHAELKSDLGVERLPSGKFHANMLHLLFSMLAYNMLRRVGTQMLMTEKTPGKRGRRLRLRTVLHSVMYLAGLLVKHAGQLFLRVSVHNAWTPAFMSSL